MSTATSNATSKLPADARALVRDPDLAAALEKELEPFNGKALDRAQDAIRKVRSSGIVGTFGDVLAAYQKAIRKATDEK